MTNTIETTQITSVPYSAIDRYEPGFIATWMARVEELTRRTQFVGGETIKKLEARLATLAGTKEARVCANGTDAIQLALRAVGVGVGDTVLIPDSTFWATFEAVCNVGGKPVTVDIDLQDLHVSANLMEEAIEKFSPKAIIMVHLYGWVAKDILKIREMCVAKNIPLIEDSAQAWGASINGESIFAGALISTTSFYPGKVLGGAGDGGAIFTNDAKLAEMTHLLANHGRYSKYEHHLVGWNSRLDVLQAAYLDISLDFTEQRLDSRRYAADWYRNNIKSPHLSFRAPAENTIENGYISVALIQPQKREAFMQALADAKIGCGIVYPNPISHQPGAKQWLAGSVTYGNTAAICSSIVNLPCFASMQQDELNYVKSHVERILNEQN